MVFDQAVDFDQSVSFRINDRNQRQRGGILQKFKRQL